MFICKDTDKGFCRVSTWADDFGPAEWDDFKGAAVTVHTYVYFDGADGEIVSIEAESLVDFRRENGAVRFIPETISTTFLTEGGAQYLSPEQAEEITRGHIPTGETLSRVVREEVIASCQEMIPDAKEYFDFMDSLNF